MTAENKSARSSKDQKRMAAIAQGLSVAPIPNVSPSYAVEKHSSTEVEYITVTLDKLKPYEHNPRKTRNPNFEVIKESIRRRGLDHPPNVTRRPGEDFYIIADGGNTRIQALKELFTETRDPRFWSINCQYKPWQGDTADSIEAELNLLIGHLIENDTRADLSFIEKALGILQAKEYYEKKWGKELSSRELSSELEKDGYIISYVIITKMERCVTHLYPHIPDVLFNGLGKPQIDKLLAIHNNAAEVWHQYYLEAEPAFEAIWAEVLANCNALSPFHVRDCQDALIERMAMLLDGKITYESLYLEIDLDERKFRRIAEKQSELDKKIEVSLEQVASHSEPVIPQNTTHTTTFPQAEPVKPVTKAAQPAEQNKHNESASVSGNELPDEIIPNFSTQPISESGSTEGIIDVKQFSQNYGLTPGMSIQEQRSKRAEENGLTFACCGRQPVDDIWTIYPARQYKVEAYSLALDIAETVGLDPLVEHVVKQPVDYSYRMKPLEEPLSPREQTIYNLLSLLQTHDFAQLASCTFDSDILFGSSSDVGIDDVTLVKIFRLIRVVRHLRQQGVSYEANYS